MKNKTFAIIGAAGYIAQRHIKAIAAIGGDIIAICDSQDNIGIIDSYYKECKYYRTLEEMEGNIDTVDYFVICTPNYLHYHHIKAGLRFAENIICEKPLVINYKHLQELKELSQELKKPIYPILQARTHPEIKRLKHFLKCNIRYDVDVKYYSHRSNWYENGWKGNPIKSGGLLFNIGIHAIDALCYLFNKLEIGFTDQGSCREISGTLFSEMVHIRYKISLDYKVIEKAKEGLKLKGINPNTLRHIKINDKEFEFSKDFSNLHTGIYENIINNNWFDINDRDLNRAIYIIDQIMKGKHYAC